MALCALSLASAPARAQENWMPSGALHDARLQHTATLLPTGDVLAAGGFGDGGGALSSTELYHPPSGSWRMGPSLSVERAEHSATLLPNGWVLIAGGSSGSGALSSAELYDSATGNFSPAGPMGQARRRHAAVLLSDGRVLVLGGEGLTGEALASAEIYDWASNTFSPATPMGTARAWASATLLSNGQVLAAGGVNGGEILRSTEVYSPATHSWSAVGNMAERRAGHSAVLLSDGRVLAFGSGLGIPRSSSELYDSVSQRWSLGGGMMDVRQHAAHALRSDGRVWVIGGDDAGSVESYDADEIAWMEGPTMPSPRYFHTATALTAGALLVVGGTESINAPVALASSVLLGGESPPVSTPPLADAGPAVSGEEGAPIALLGEGSDADGDPLTFQWTYAPGADASPDSRCTFSSPSAAQTFIACEDEGTYTATLSVSDGHGPAVTAQAAVSVTNAAPTAVGLSGAADGQLFALAKAQLSLSMSFADAGIRDSHACAFEWDDGTRSEVPAAAGQNECAATHRFSAAGVYTIRAAVSDGDGGQSGVRTVRVVVHSPGEGYASGGGWAPSPRGAYAARPKAHGPALFGFIAGYLRGDKRPSGNFAFHLAAGGLTFVSTRYDWLVVSGGRAQLAGRGTVNGRTGYEFLLTVADGHSHGSHKKGVDRFRLRVTGPQGLVYDSGTGAELDLDSMQLEAISGGSIVVHR